MFVSLLFTVALRTLITTGLINTLSYILNLDRFKVSNSYQYILKREIGQEMASKASQAGEVLAKLNLRIQAEAAQGIANPNYKIQNENEAINKMNSQRDRMAEYETMKERHNELRRELRVTPPPILEDPRWKECEDLVHSMDDLAWEGVEKETTILRNWENTANQRKNNTEQEMAKVAKIQEKLESIGVPEDIRIEIERGLERIPNDPGKRLSLIIEAIKDGFKGDQTSVREQIMEQVKSMPSATDKKGVEEGISKIRLYVSNYDRSAAMDRNGEAFPDKTAMEALERVCLDWQPANAKVRECKANTVITQTFASQSREVLDEMERITNLTRKVIKDKTKDAETEYKDGRENAAVAMAASRQQTQQVQQQLQSTYGGSATCIPFYNLGHCNRNRCTFEHRQNVKGNQLPWPKSRGDDRRSSPNRYDERNEERERSEERGSRSGGRGDQGRQQKGGSDRRSGDKSTGGDERRFERERSRSPKKQGSSSSSSSYSRRSRSPASDGSGEGATPPQSWKQAKSRPDTPKGKDNS